MQYQPLPNTPTPERAAIRLLALEPLTFARLRFYTGWDFEKATAVVRSLERAGAIQRVAGINNSTPLLDVRGTVEQALARADRVRRAPHLRSVA